MTTVFGTNGGDTLYGTANGNDTLKGFGGDDVLKGGGGADMLYGGSGIDTAMYSDSPTGVTVDLMNGIGRHGTADGDTLSSIENVYGSSYGDWLRGSSDANALYGLNGNDLLEGGFGADLLDGGYGNDTLAGGAGADTLNGGEGSDATDYRDSPAGVFVSLVSDLAWGGHAEGDNLNSIENVIGSDFSDALVGDDGANMLEGHGGHDSLKGGGGADTLWGFDGDDSLLGMAGNDELVGDNGHDVLNGGPGADHMYGGDGADTFVFSSIGDVGLTMATSDWVLDVDAEGGDRIDLSGIDADVYAPGNQSFTFIGTAPFSGNPGEIRYFTVSDGTFEEIYFELQIGTSVDIEGMIHVGENPFTPNAGWFIL